MLSKEQKTSKKNIELRTNDVSRTNKSRPVTTDEYLYELANTKARNNKQILDAVKTTAMDCDLYKGSNEMVCYNFGKVSSNAFSTVPILEQDSTQNAELNVKKTKISGVIVEILGKRYIAKSTSTKNTKELYDVDPPHEFVGTAILENGLWRIEYSTEEYLYPPKSIYTHRRVFIPTE